MTLADKIMLLRKQQGWSQIDLADRLDVSRQSVSKWEMAQAVPELDKIIKMSELFDVTCDYLLKDNPADSPPPPLEEPEPEPEPEPEQPQAPAPEPISPPKSPRKKWPWILAAVLALPVILTILLIVLSYMPYSHNYTSETSEPLARESSFDPTVSPTPTPVSAAETTIEAVSTDGTAQAPDMELYSYSAGQTTLEGGFISPEEMEAIAREYEPFGVTYDTKAQQWYYDGEPVRVFTDILTSNGEPLEVGNFKGTIRNFAGNGAIDIRTIRDYDNPNADGNGTLTGIERYDADPDAAWGETP